MKELDHDYSRETKEDLLNEWVDFCARCGGRVEKGDLRDHDLCDACFETALKLGRAPIPRFNAKLNSWVTKFNIGLNAAPISVFSDTYPVITFDSNDETTFWYVFGRTHVHYAYPLISFHIRS